MILTTNYTKIPHSKTISQKSHIARQYHKNHTQQDNITNVSHKHPKPNIFADLCLIFSTDLVEGSWAWKCKGFTSFASSCQIYLSLALAVTWRQHFIHRDLGFWNPDQDFDNCDRRRISEILLDSAQFMKDLMRIPESTLRRTFFILLVFCEHNFNTHFA